MGGLATFFFLVEVVTGVLLMFYYRPTAEFAYIDIVALREHVAIGLLREMHRWAGHAMVVVVWLHMLRVFLTGSYKRPREFNWVIGVVLLVATLFLSFTGYLLPWDQLAIVAVTVGANMAGAGLVHRDPLYFWSEVCGVEVECVGAFDREADRVELDGSFADGAFVQRRYAGDRLTAAILVGQEEARAGELADEILDAWAG